MATLLLLAGIRYYVQSRQQLQINEYAGYELEEGLDPSDKQTVQFLPNELKGINKMSLSAVTFCTGNFEQVAPILEQRVADIRQANPWLGGFLAPDKNENGELRLFYDETLEKQTPPSFRSYEPGEIPLTQETSFQQYNDICEQHDIKVPHTDLLVGKNVPLWRVTLIPDADAPQEKFILVVSMAHMLGDSCTFYTLYNQLSPSNPLQTLNPNRVGGIDEKAVNHLGEEEMKFLETVASNKAAEDDDKEDASESKGLRSLFQRTSKEEVAEEKEEEESLQEVLIFRVGKFWLMQQKGFHPDVTDEACLIVSWFFRLFQPEVALIGYSLRRIVPDLKHLDAGNYSSPVPLTSRDYRKPQDVQQALSAGRRSSHSETTLPENPSSFAVATDWSYFGKVIQGNGDGDKSSRSVQQTNHFPLFDADDVKCLSKNTSGIVVFQASPDELGVLCIVPKERTKDVLESGIIGRRTS